MQVPAEWPDERFDLIVFSEVLYFLSAADIERCARHVVRYACCQAVLLSWSTGWAEPTIRVRATLAPDRFIAATAGRLLTVVIRQERHERYRLDILLDRSSAGIRDLLSHRTERGWQPWHRRQFCAGNRSASGSARGERARHREPAPAGLPASAPAGAASNAARMQQQHRSRRPGPARPARPAAGLVSAGSQIARTTTNGRPCARCHPSDRAAFQVDRVGPGRRVQDAASPPRRRRSLDPASSVCAGQPAEPIRQRRRRREASRPRTARRDGITTVPGRSAGSSPPARPKLTSAVAPCSISRVAASSAPAGVPPPARTG